MLTIVLLGTGNLATHLFQAFSKSREANVIQVYGRDSSALSYFNETVDTTSDPEKLQKADVYFCAVSDDAIATVSKFPREKEAIIVHCSGAVPLTVLPKGGQRGVFYPLQSFTKGREIDFSKVPVCIEAEKESVLGVLTTLGKSISDTCITIDSDQRKALHLAAVFANNFTNHLLHRAAMICDQHQLPFSLLKPLIAETVAKLDTLAPYEAQTGPARRGDMESQENHLALMHDLKDKELYRILSQAIQDTYGN